MKNPYWLEQAADTAPENLPSTAQYLTQGGDERIALDTNGLNKYGCRPFPDSGILAYGSSTASIISTEGYPCAHRLHQRVLVDSRTALPASVYRREIERIRAELIQLCGLPTTTDVIFSPSGTDIHTLAAQSMRSGVSLPPRIVMIETNETGTGVAAAMTGIDRHTSEVVQVRIRLSDGTPRPQADIDADVTRLVSDALASEQRVLLILIDQSKTGLIAPSLSCVLTLYRRFQGNMDVLVDACQFRLSEATLRAYLAQGFMVALTGSKFLTGPSFSGVLLIPPKTRQRLPLNPPALPVANLGLLLRWEVALHELRTFRAVPQATVINFLHDFSDAIQQRLHKDPLFEPLAVPQLDRRPLLNANNWDHLQTIFPFLLYHANAERTPLSAEETQSIYQQLPVNLHFNTEHPDAFIAAMRCQTGQPVASGKRNGITVSALRLCISTRLIVKAATDGDKGATVIAEALVVLDKIALLIRLSANS